MAGRALSTASDKVVFGDVGVGLPKGTRLEDRPLERQQAYLQRAAALVPALRGELCKLGAPVLGRSASAPRCWREASLLRDTSVVSSGSPGMGQEVMDLLAGGHGGQRVVIFGSDLGEEGPIGVTEEIYEEQVGGGTGLADGLGGPLFLEFDEQEVVPQLRLGDGLWVAADVLVDEPELAVVGVPGSIGVVAQS